MKVCSIKSATYEWINYIALIIAIIALAVGVMYNVRSFDLAILMMFSYVMPIITLEVIFYNTPYNPETGLEKTKWNLNFKRVLIKLTGLYTIYFIIYFAYWLFPEYYKQNYVNYWKLISLIFVPTIIISVPYFIYTDTKSTNPLDEYYKLGILMFTQKSLFDKGELKQLCLQWSIKAFFLPLMFSPLVNNISIFTNTRWSQISYYNSPEIINIAINIIFTFDLMIAASGYLMTLKLFNSHVRTVEPTAIGWLICIICYAPFNTAILSLYFPYSSNSWMLWLSDYPLLLLVWGIAVLTLLILYLLSSVSFGCRFSNLTNRGIITAGLYRYSKHPAYISKVLFWWMTCIPFIATNSISNSIREICFMIGISLIYLFRAKTEERHLSQSDSKYIEYALWINKFGIFRQFTYIFPFLKYNHPDNDQNDII